MSPGELVRFGHGGCVGMVGSETQPHRQAVITVQTLKIYVTGILALWSVVGSFLAWECLCGSPVCEWCSCPPPAPEWLYGAPNGSQGVPEFVPYLSTYQHHITNPVTCTLDRL